MRNLIKVCLCIFVLNLIACSSSSLTEDIVGTFVGSYDEVDPASTLSAIGVELTVAEAGSDEAVLFTMTLGSMNIAFPGIMTNAEEFVIDNATIDAINLTGSGKLEGDNIKIDFRTLADDREYARYSGMKN